MEKEEARQQYENIVRRRIDPALLEYMGDNVFKLSVFPIEPDGNAMSERRIEITYAELLPYQSGQVSYTFFMKTVNMSSKPVQTAALSVDLTSQLKILSMESPTHATSSKLQISRQSAFHYTAIFGNENADSETDLVLVCKQERADYSISHLTYVPSVTAPMPFDSMGDLPYFLIWITPPDSAQPIAKRVAFVADISSSMSGTRITQLKEALNGMIDMLGSDDNFNIIAFSTGIKKFQPDVVTASAANIQAAHTFINNLSEMGLTDIEDALKEALKSTWDSSSVNSIVFLTDGKPTWPQESNAQRIIDTVAKLNVHDVSIHTFGISEEVELSFLKRLAAENAGVCINILDNATISATLQDFMHKISYPLIKNIAVDFGGLQSSELLPVTLPDMYAGAQLTLLGRLKNAGEYKITFTGAQAAKEIVISSTLAFPSDAENHPFVPRMWASQKIGWLLDEMAIHGETKEEADAVKGLGLKYGIVTPYTSMLVVEPTPVNNNPNNPTTQVRTARALPALGLQLFQNIPNPFMSTTQIRYTLPRFDKAQTLVIRVFDMRGMCIRTLVRKVTSGNENTLVTWDATDQAGRRVGAGLYYAVMEIGNERQMICMKLMQ
jgi:Ca-activated chloride channel family protein